MYVCVCVFVCVYAFMCACVCLYLSMYVCMHLCMCVCIYVYLCVSVRVLSAVFDDCKHVAEDDVSKAPVKAALSCKQVQKYTSRSQQAAPIAT